MQQDTLEKKDDNLRLGNIIRTCTVSLRLNSTFCAYNIHEKTTKPQWCWPFAIQQMQLIKSG